MSAGLTRGLFVLWAAEIPIRFSDINDTPPVVIRVIWLVAGSLSGARAGRRRHPGASRARWTEAVLLTLPLHLRDRCALAAAV